MSIMRKGQRGPYGPQKNPRESNSEEHCRNIGKSMIEVASRPGVKTKKAKAATTHPNGLERDAIDLFGRKTDKAIFNGYSHSPKDIPKGYVVVKFGGKAPDFIIEGQSYKVIEVLGSHYHSEEMTGRPRLGEEQYVKDYYKEYDVNCECFWDDEIQSKDLKVLVATLNKLVDFIGR